MTAQESQDTKKELIEALRRLANELGRSPTVADLRVASGYPPVSRFLEVFGSWNEAKQAADLQTYRKAGRGKTYSRDELIDRLRRLARTTEGEVTKRDVMEADSCPSAVTYQRHFGSWNAAKQAAELETIEPDETPIQYTDDDLCELLRRLADEVDHPLTIRDIELAEGVPDHTTFERRFGSWNRAKQAAGLQTIEKGQGQRGDTYSDHELLELLRDRAAEVEGPLTAAAMDKADGYPASSTYKRRFGLWRAAKDRAGIDCLEKTGRRYTDDQLLTILHELAAPLDRSLTRSDVEAAEDAPAVSTFERRFGSWNEAKRAAGLNILDQGQQHD